jgi:pimeloyl-ACP methyl ester carboxylesterase
VDYIWAYLGEALARSTRGPTDELKAYRRVRETPAFRPVQPTVVWHGAEDGLTSLPALLQYLADDAAEVRLIEGVGHMMVLKHWREILERVAVGPAAAG